jgi:hypothetical protein
VDTGLWRGRVLIIGDGAAMAEASSDPLPVVEAIDVVELGSVR